MQTYPYKHACIHIQTSKKRRDKYVHTCPNIPFVVVVIGLVVLLAGPDDIDIGKNVLGDDTGILPNGINEYIHNHAYIMHR